ncbi:chorismate mutase [Candidatus Poriferisodalis sp.]|uniref:chorismate mutase n=1 Tax=Candidatus Poriferisodalis sp. TaxID=3101277 RepID=UPI003B02948A
MGDDELAAYRRRIDEADEQLVSVLARRFRITHEIGVFKAAHGVPAVDLERQDQQIAKLRQLAEQEGLDPDFCERFALFVMDEVVRNHVRIAESASKNIAAPAHPPADDPA